MVSHTIVSRSVAGVRESDDRNRQVLNMNRQNIIFVSLLVAYELWRSVT